MLDQKQDNNVLYTLQGINISPPKWHFEDDFPFPKVGYVNPLEGKQYPPANSLPWPFFEMANKWPFEKLKSARRRRRFQTFFMFIPKYGEIIQFD